jgi:trehalose/maltose hydrolase-like predicted phosphorylase
MMGGWSLVYEEFNPEKEGLRETLCTLGNGYFCTRGAADEAVDDGIRYRGYFLRLEICCDHVKVTSLRNREYPIRVGWGEEIVELNGRDTIEFPLG